MLFKDILLVLLFVKVAIIITLATDRFITLLADHIEKAGLGD